MFGMKPVPVLKWRQGDVDRIAQAKGLEGLSGQAMEGSTEHGALEWMAGGGRCQPEG